MEKEENIVSCGKKNLTQREIEMQSEIVSLKRQLGGYKKSNDLYRKKIAKLEKLAKHNRAVDIEGDHLYEEKLAELEKTKKELGDVSLKIAEYKSSIETKDGFIESLQQKCSGLMVENKVLANRTSALEELIDEAEETIAELRKPWWKRLF